MPKSARPDPDFDAKLTAALAGGARLHGFRSGGGLRVLRLERDDKLVGYGEHCNISGAMALLVEDYAAGGRPYKEVYGSLDTDGEYELYLTGSPAPESFLDEWLLQGRTFDAHFTDNAVTVELYGWEQFQVPESVKEAASANPDTKVRYVERGFTYEIVSHTRPRVCVTARAIECPEGVLPVRALMWQTIQTGRGSTFERAVDAAKNAPKQDRSEE